MPADAPLLAQGMLATVIGQADVMIRHARIARPAATPVSPGTTTPSKAASQRQPGEVAGALTSPGAGVDGPAAAGGSSAQGGLGSPLHLSLLGVRLLAVKLSAICRTKWIALSGEELNKVTTSAEGGEGGRSGRQRSIEEHTVRESEVL